MNSKISKFIPSIVTAVLGIVIVLIIPSQIDLSRVSNTAKGINARTIPYFLSSFIILLSVIDLILKKIKADNEVEKTDRVKVPFKSYLRVLLTFLGIFVWILTVPYLGFFIGMTLLLILIMFLMGNRKWYLMLSIPILTSLTLNYVFNEFVGRTLPSGIFFN